MILNFFLNCFKDFWVDICISTVWIGCNYILIHQINTGRPTIIISWLIKPYRLIHKPIFTFIKSKFLTGLVHITNNRNIFFWTYKNRILILSKIYVWSSQSLVCAKLFFFYLDKIFRTFFFKRCVKSLNRITCFFEYVYRIFYVYRLPKVVFSNELYFLWRHVW